MNRFERNRERFIDWTDENFEIVCFIAGIVFGTVVLYVTRYMYVMS